MAIVSVFWLKFQQRDLITVIMHCYTMAIFQIVSLLAMKWNGTIWVDWLTRAYLPHMVFALGAMVSQRYKSIQC